MATIVTRAGKGSPLTISEVDANFTNLNTDKAELSGATFTGEITANAGIALPDSQKATFGAGDDLQIYHDGANSYITETGTGNLYITASDSMFFQSSDNTHRYAEFINGGGVKLRFDNSDKLETTSTGIDVTGTATMDGLTVDGGASLNGNIEINSATVSIILNETDRTDENTQLLNASGNFRIRTRSDDGNTNTDRLRIDHGTGDVSFYEDTGTTAKMVWDASAESLGIGTSSPSAPLSFGSITNDARIHLRGNTNEFAIGTNGLQTVYAGYQGHVFQTGSFGGTERMRITSAGALQLSDVNSPNDINTAIYSNSDVLEFEAFGTNGAIAFTTGSSVTERMRIRSDGTVSILGAGNTAGGNLALGDTDDGRAKWSYITGAHYNAATETEGVAMIGVFGDDGNSSVVIGGSIYEANPATSIQFYTHTASTHGVGGTKQATIDSTGNLTLNNGNLVINTAGKGIFFGGAAGAGGMTSQLLDDYEEGTFSSVFTMPSGSVTYNAGTGGVYTKIGRMVHVNAWIYVGALSSPSGTLTLALPFANAGNARASQITVVNRWTSVTGQIGCWLSNNSTSLNFVVIDNGTMFGSSLNGTNMQTNCEMYLNFSYETA